MMEGGGEGLLEGKLTGSHQSVLYYVDITYFSKWTINWSFIINQSNEIMFLVFCFP